MTVDCWCVREPSRHRHVHRHRGSRVGKLLPRYHDGDDAHDDEMRVFSIEGCTSLLRRLSYPFNLTLPTDEKDGPSGYREHCRVSN